MPATGSCAPGHATPRALAGTPTPDTTATTGNPIACTSQSDHLGHHLHHHHHHPSNPTAPSEPATQAPPFHDLCGLRIGATDSIAVTTAAHLGRSPSPIGRGRSRSTEGSAPLIDAPAARLQPPTPPKPHHGVPALPTGAGSGPPAPSSAAPGSRSCALRLGACRTAAAAPPRRQLTLLLSFLALSVLSGGGRGGGVTLAAAAAAGADTPRWDAGAAAAAGGQRPLRRLLLLTDSAAAGNSSSNGGNSSSSSNGGNSSSSGGGGGGGGGGVPPINYELPGNPDELLRCINGNQPDHNGTSWDSAMLDVPPMLKVVGMWWSSKPARVPLTVTTQLSWNRKWQLKAMCRSWGGPIAAVMHMPVLLPRLVRRPDAVLADLDNNTLQRAVDKVAAFHAKMDANHPCKLDLMLLAEPYLDGRSLLLYPVNLLRNYARLMARTPLIALADVDLILSQSFHTELLDPAVAASYVAMARSAEAAAAAGRTGAAFATGHSRVAGLEEEAAALNVTAPPPPTPGAGGGGRSGAGSAAGGAPRAAFVLPAFVTRGGSVSAQMVRADKLVLLGKAQLHEHFKTKQVARFDPMSSGHKPTNYPAWFAATEPYAVQWAARYEPWLLVDRLSSSWSDARFRGYGKNKIANVRTLAYEGYELLVHPSAFLLHRPHLDSSSSNAHARNSGSGKRGKSSSMFGHNNYLYKHISQEMLYGNYTTVLDPATAACRTSLSWWKDVRTA